MNINALLAVCAGASIGASFRWFFAMGFNHIFPQLPLGTLIVNMIGGLLAGIMIALLSFGWFESTSLRLFITTGLMGGLTTFSTFTTESLQLLHKQDYFWFGLHTVSHVLGALLCAMIGYALVQMLKGNTIA